MDPLLRSCASSMASQNERSEWMVLGPSPGAGSEWRGGDEIQVGDNVIVVTLEHGCMTCGTSGPHELCDRSAAAELHPMASLIR